MRFQTGKWSLHLLPELGGRVVSLRYGEGRQWLATSDRAWPSPAPVRWIDGDARGWDECFPNISAGPHPGTGAQLPDHGDLWNTTTVTTTEPHHHLRTSWPTSSVRAVVQRELGAAGDALRVAYRAESGENLSAAWAMHLLLDAEPAAVELPADVPVRVDSRFGTAEDELVVSAPDEWTPWGEIRPKLLELRGGWGAKLFTRPGAAYQVQVRQGGESLTLSFENAPVKPTFGLWFNADVVPSLPGVRHVGVEASFGDHDDLVAAVASGSTLSLAPEPLTWSVLVDHGWHPQAAAPTTDTVGAVVGAAARARSFSDQAAPKS